MKMRKILSVFVLFLLLSSFAASQEIVDDSDEQTCVGFWGKVSCILFGDPARKALVGQVLFPGLFEDGKVLKDATHTAVDSEGNIFYLRETNGKTEIFGDGNWVPVAPIEQLKNTYTITPAEGVPGAQQPTVLADPTNKNSGYTYSYVDGKWQSLNTNNKQAKWIEVDPKKFSATIDALNKAYPGGVPPPAAQPPTPLTAEQLEEGANIFLKGAPAKLTAAPVPTPTAPGTAAAPGAPPASLSPETQAALKNALGETIYNRYLGENGEFFKNYDFKEGVLVKKDVTATITLSPEENNFRTVRVTAKNAKGADTIFNTLSLNGQEIARETRSGEIVVAGQTVKLPKGKTIDSLKTEAFFFGKTDEKEGGKVSVVTDSEGKPTGEVVVFNYDDETRTVQNTETGEVEETSGDHYIQGEAGCQGGDGCYFADGGTITVVGRKYSIEYDWNTPFFAERKLERKELFCADGRRCGVEEGGARIIAKQDKKGKYTDEVEIKEGDTTIRAKKVTGNWVNTGSPKVDAATAKVEKLQQNIQDVNTAKASATGPATMAYGEAYNNALAAQTALQNKLNEVSAAKSALQKTFPSKEAAENAVVIVALLEKEAEGLGAESVAANQVLQQREAELNEAGQANDEILQNLQAQLTTAEQEKAAAENEAGAAARAIIPKHQKKADEVQFATTGGLKTAATVIESIYAVTEKIQSYPALSKLFFGETSWYSDHLAWADRTFAPALGSNWFPSWCESLEKWTDVEPTGTAVIKTVSGTYQAVASIQMEKSERKSPILCQRNPDQEAEQQYICERGQVCVDDSFCYEDEDDDGEADSEEPLPGYFYKITWAVSSPSDETYTPFVDENGVAVSFNIYLYSYVTRGQLGAGTPFEGQSKPLYNRLGNIRSPIELKNGESDRDAIIKYSPNEYLEACIVWDKAPTTTKGQFSGAVPIPHVCFPAVTSSVGQVNWERAGQSGASVSAGKGDITRNTDW